MVNSLSLLFFSSVYIPHFSRLKNSLGKKPDLTLSNFFSEGWKFGQWEEPEQEPDQSPRFRLLKIPATVFEREVRMNYSFTNNGDSGNLDEHEWEFEFEMPVSRRLLIEVKPTIVSVSPKSDNDHSGFGDALTKTVTPKDTPFFGNLTFFVEFNGSSDIGSNVDTTVVSILPGARWNLGHGFWLMPGVEFPITGRDEFDNRIWFSVLKDF